MADSRAIAAVCQAVVNLLEAEAALDTFGPPPPPALSFEVYTAANFADHMTAGVSLFPYRIYYDGVHRTPAGRIDPDGRRHRSRLPLNLHFMLTAWADHGSLQNVLAGWMLRVMEDNPVLSATWLNTAFDEPVFDPDETVEIVPADLSTEDLFRIWDVLIQDVYQLSVPFVARGIRIDSRHLEHGGEPVRQREIAAARPEEAG